MSTGRKILFLILAAFLFGGVVSPIFAAPPEDIQAAIRKKNEELDAIATQAQATQKQLDEIQGQGKSLEKEIKQIDQNINQLNLNIKSSQITVEKINLEIESIGYGISESEASIVEKKEQIAKIMQEIQKQSDQSPFAIILKNQSLSESISEIQSLSDLQSGLQKSIDELRTEKEVLSQRHNEQTAKKKSKEVETQNLQNRKFILDDVKEERASILTETKNKEKIYEEVMSTLEQKQREIGAEIDELEKALRATFNQKNVADVPRNALTCPLTSCVITQQYGNTSFARTAYKSGFHNGMDFKAAIGTPIYAAADGLIEATGDNGKVQYGKYVLIRHENGLSTLYGHLSRIIASKNASVKRGDIIGYSGNTGYSTGPHLHFGVYWGAEVTLQYISGAGMVPVGPTLDPSKYMLL